MEGAHQDDAIPDRGPYPFQVRFLWLNLWTNEAADGVRAAAGSGSPAKPSGQFAHRGRPAGVVDPEVPAPNGAEVGGCSSSGLPSWDSGRGAEFRVPSRSKNARFAPCASSSVRSAGASEPPLCVDTTAHDRLPVGLVARGNKTSMSKTSCSKGPLRDDGRHGREAPTIATVGSSVVQWIRRREAGASSRPATCRRHL